MKLAENRLIAAIKEHELPLFSEEFKQMLNMEIPVEVDWETFESDTKAIENLRLPHHGLGAIRQAFYQVCRDDVGKTAVQRGVAKIVVRHAGDILENNMTLEEGLLVVNWRWDGGESPYHNIVSYLEEALP